MKICPTLYLSHGSPMTALQPRQAGHFMRHLGPALAACCGTPTAIVAISAHTLTREPVLLGAPRHEAVYDFSGFDPQLQTLRYDAPGAPGLAARVAAMLKDAGLPAHATTGSGLDHGIWTPLRYMFPAAQVPVLPLGWPPHWSPQQLFALGRALAPLAHEGVLVMASGSITHNLSRVFASGSDAAVDRAATPESTAFRDWFAARAAAGDWQALLDYRSQAPHAVLMHPTDEHLLPFFVAAGAAVSTEDSVMTGQRIHASLTFGDLGMDAYAFGAAAPELAAALAAARA